VLVVDDHVDLAENLREILEGEGAQVVVAVSAAEALAAAEHGFDIALVDIRLPDATGLSLVPALKSRAPDSEILLVTGHASIDDAIEAVRFGAYAYVLKPFDPEELVSTAARALAQVRLRRRAATLQSALERSEAALRTLVDTVQALLLVLDEGGRVLLANPAVAMAAGVDLAALLGADWVEAFVPQRDRAALRAAFARIAAGEPGVAVDSGLVRRGEDGRIDERTVRWRLAGLRTDTGWRVYASGLDVTEVRELERRARLAEKLAAVGTVSAGLAHEIRNPLNAADLQLQLLERRLARAGAGQAMLEPVGLVRDEVARLSRLVSEFLLFARPTGLAARDIDLSVVAADVVEMQVPVAGERGVSLTLSRPEEPIVVEIDGERMKQVVLNLVRNAIEATPSGGRVHVVVEPDGAGGRLVVRDQGEGIPPEHLPRIFEPFFTTKESGTGLGMAICHSIVELHGGRIDVRSDGGAEFAVSLRRRTPRLGHSPGRAAMSPGE
jgi:PAS domain S-box-containing protein